MEFIIVESSGKARTVSAERFWAFLGVAKATRESRRNRRNREHREACAKRNRRQRVEAREIRQQAFARD